MCGKRLNTAFFRDVRAQKAAFCGFFRFRGNLRFPGRKSAGLSDPGFPERSKNTPKWGVFQTFPGRTLVTGFRAKTCGVRFWHRQNLKKLDGPEKGSGLKYDLKVAGSGHFWQEAP